jgi:hypothetical protein
MRVSLPAQRIAIGALAILLCVFPVMAHLCDLACGEDPDRSTTPAHCGGESESPNEQPAPPCRNHPHDRTSIASAPAFSQISREGPQLLAEAVLTFRASLTISASPRTMRAPRGSHSPPAPTILRT